MSGIYGSEYGETIIPGELGSTNLTSSQDNSGNTSGLTNLNTDYLTLESDAFNNPAGNTANNYVMPDAYSYSSDPGLMDKLAGFAKNLYTTNGALDFRKIATLLGGTVAAFNANQGNQGGSGAGYQGGIPTLYAGRNMITAPPKMIGGKPRRAGGQGINYGGDVTYFNTKKEVDELKAIDDARAAGLAALNTQNTGTTGSNTAVTGNTANTGNTTNLSNAAGTTTFKATYPGSNTAVNATGLTPQIANFLMYQSSAGGGAKTADFDKYGGYAAVAKLAEANGYAPTAAWMANYEKAAGLPASEYTKINTPGSAENLKMLSDAAKRASGVNTAATNTAATNTVGTNTANSGITGLSFGSSWNALKNDTAAAAKLAADTAAANKLISDAATIANKETGSTGNVGLTNLVTNNAGTNNAATNNVVNNAAVNTPTSYYDEGAGMELLYPQASSLQKLGLDDYSSMQFAEGGMAKGRYLQGGTDGMADELPAKIGADQPAALSHGEFVIPADVVSHMGNGNSDAGAKKLYQMMDKIRMARTGNKKQGKKINPDKFMPGGLAAAYAAGGKVKHFQEGGTTSASKLAGLGITGTESNLSNWAGPYVTNMLGQGQALANMPYQAYTGDLTAGTTPLLSSAFTNATNLSTPASIGNAATTAGSIATKAKDLAYTPTTTSFDSTQLTNYMNPYLDKILTPQLEAARRQSEITQQQNAGQMTKAGAYGGGRQAIMDTETQRNLADVQAGITGKGYDTAFTNAMAQFNADQARKAQEAQFGANYGLQGLNTGLQAANTQGGLGVQQNQVGLANLAQQLAAGTVERGIESEGIAADRAQFEEARANPYKMLQFQQSLLQGMPLASQAYNTGSESAIVAAAKGARTVNELLAALGIKTPA
jgi:hypothetical protein